MRIIIRVCIFFLLVSCRTSIHKTEVFSFSMLIPTEITVSDTISKDCNDIERRCAVVFEDSTEQNRIAVSRSKTNEYIINEDFLKNRKEYIDLGNENVDWISTDILEINGIECAFLEYKTKLHESGTYNSQTTFFLEGLEYNIIIQAQYNMKSIEVLRRVIYSIEQLDK